MTTVRKQKSSDQLAPGDWVAAGELASSAVEVLYALTYPGPSGFDLTYLVARALGSPTPFSDKVAASTFFELASDEDLAGYREAAERAERIAEIRRFADWLESNPWVPMPYHIYGSEQLNGDESDPVAGLAKVREIAERLGVETDESAGDRTKFKFPIGKVEYSLLTWHKNGRSSASAE
jgi:hypothetical protein